MGNYDLIDYLGMMFADLLGIFVCLMGWKWVVHPATKESLGPVFFVWLVVILVIASIFAGLFFLFFLAMFVVWVYFSFSEILERRTSKNINKKKEMGNRQDNPEGGSDHENPTKD